MPQANRIGVFSLGRKQSERCPNKMLRPFADTTLTDLILEKLAVLPYDTFFAGYEPEFKAKCHRAGVRFVQRDHHSIMIDQPIVEILSFLRSVEYEHVLLVSPCLPFLGVESIRRFAEDCLDHDVRPAFSVVRRKNYFLTLRREPLNFDLRGKTINTKTVKPVYEFAHALYFFNRRFFLREGRYWDWRRVRLIELPAGRELLDVDTEEDFSLISAMWSAERGQTPSRHESSLRGLTPASIKY